MKQKYVLVIGDGMADRPVPELGGKTPLEAAHTPTVDRLCEKSVIGKVQTVPEGLPAGSDVAILSIFGNRPQTCYTGRSPLEAAGAGVSLVPGNVSYRCNMIALDEAVEKPLSARLVRSHSGGGIEGEESMELISFLWRKPAFAALAEQMGLRIYPTPSFRHIAVQDSADLKGFAVTPPHDILNQPAGGHLPCGCRAAEQLRALMELAPSLLQDHPINQARRAQGKLPANGIWFWAEGQAAPLENFEKKYGKTGGVISAVPLVFGIGALAGMEMIRVPGATGELDTDYRGKAEAACKALARLDFVCVHVEAPDECTHNGDLAGKIKAIEAISEQVIAPLCEGLAGEPFRLLFLSDHETLTETRTHASGPVPFFLYDSMGETDSGLPYTEDSANKGEWIADGSTLMARLLGRA